MATQILVQMTVYDPAITGDRILYFCSGVGNTFGADTYQPRISSNPTYRLQAEGYVVGLGYGSFNLANTDSALDVFIDYTFKGKPIKIYRVDDASTTLGVPSLSNMVFDGVMDDPEIGNTITVRYRSATLALDKPLLTAFYAGTGALEGNADLTGQPKPLVIGHVLNSTTPLVDPAKNIYQISAWLVGGTTATGTATVYDSGLPLTAGANYVSVADMNANVPSPGQVRVLPPENSGSTGMYFRLGSIATGEVTCSSIITWNGSSGTTASVINHVLKQAGGTDALQASDGGSTGTNYHGVLFNEQLTVAEALDRVSSASRSWITRYAGTDNKWAMRWLSEPSTAFQSARTYVDGSARSVATVEGDEVVSISRLVGASIPAPPHPVKRATARYGRIWTVQTSGLAATVDSIRRSFLSQEYRGVVSEDLTITARFPLAEEVELFYGAHTLGESWVATDIATYLTVTKVRRDVFKVRCAVDTYKMWQTIPGDPIKIQNCSRFNLTTTRWFLVMGYELNLATGIADLILWG